MTAPEIQARIRDLARELKALRRQLRGPRSVAAKTWRKAERKARVKAICDEWVAIKHAVNDRAVGRCEVRYYGARCPHAGYVHDHFWGGIGRRRELQSAENVWLLCALHNEDRTQNEPNRLWWVEAFLEHAMANGLKSQLPLIARERARIEGKARGGTVAAIRRT